MLGTVRYIDRWINGDIDGWINRYIDYMYQFSSVTQSCPALCDLVDWRLPCPSPTPRACSNSHSLSQRCHPAISSSAVPLLLPPSIFPSIRVFSRESVLHIRWLKYWSFNLSISYPNKYSGLISFRNDWLDLLAIQGTLKNLLWHHSSKASILWLSLLSNSHIHTLKKKT